MRISDWSSDVCSSDLPTIACCFIAWATFSSCSSTMRRRLPRRSILRSPLVGNMRGGRFRCVACRRSEEHTSELQSLMRISYAVFCLQKNIILIQNPFLIMHILLLRLLLNNDLIHTHTSPYSHPLQSYLQ